MEKAPINISAAIITFNEGDRLKQCLEKVAKVCDEIIILDSGSIDDTISVATEFNAKIFNQTFEGFGLQKRKAVELTSNDWVLCIDADEILSDALINEINHLKINGFNADAYNIPRYFFFLGNQMQGGNEHKKSYVRLFNKVKAQFNEAAVHEDVINTGNTLTLKNILFHHSYRSIDHYFQKYNHYTTLAAKELAKKVIQKSVFWLFWRFQIGFFQYYFLKGFWKDGFAGFVWSFLSATYPVVKYAKARALQINE